MTPKPPQTPESSENETNLTSQLDSDLEDAREFVLDYLRMRMAEEVFHFTIINQIKIAVPDKFSKAISNLDSRNDSSVFNPSPWLIEEMFDIKYPTGYDEKEINRVLFRIKVCLIMWPIPPYLKVIEEIMDCIITYLSPWAIEDFSNWMPSIQKRMASIMWDKVEKPIPLLVVEQLNIKVKTLGVK